MLESKRLYYLKWEAKDFDLLKDTLGNPKVCQYLPGKNNKTDEEIQKWLDFYVNSFNDDLGNKIYKIIQKDTGEVIGYGGLGYVKEFNQIEIMYGFSQKYWGLGYATEVSQRLKDLAQSLGITFLIALSDINNEASKKVLIKTGFKEINQIELWGSMLYYYEMNI